MAKACETHDSSNPLYLHSQALPCDRVWQREEEEGKEEEAKVEEEAEEEEKQRREREDGKQNSRTTSRI